MTQARRRSAARCRLHRTALIGALLLTPIWAAAPATAQDGRQVVVNVPAQGLGAALSNLAGQAGFEVIVPAGLLAGKSSAPLSGRMTPEQALARLLAGSGLDYAFIGPGSVAITAPAPVGPAGEENEVLLLDPVVIHGRLPFARPAAIAQISGESIEQFRGSSPAEIFRAAPGVGSGNPRSGGGIDVNLRGQQGLGRVDVKIDGAANALTVYQGYQGVSNRSYVDPDLLADVSISKGPASDSFGVAGQVEMRTLSADDILAPGKNFGLRLRGSLGGNTVTPKPGSRSGYIYPSRNRPDLFAEHGPEGMDRPSPLRLRDNAGSAVLGFRLGNLDGVLGYAWRNQGNYHAGTKGAHAKPVALGPTDICTPNQFVPGLDNCVNWPNFIANEGISSYRAGEEVLNSELATRSGLLKLDWRIAEGQKLSFSYMHYDSEQGDILASGFSGHDNKLGTVQGRTSLTDVKSGSLQYRWDPVDNDLIDLSATLWGSRMEQRHPRRNAAFVPPLAGVPATFRTGLDADAFGLDLTNRSHVATGFGPLVLDFGLSYRRESTAPSHLTVYFERQWAARDGVREEAAAFVKGELHLNDQWSLNGSLRYQHFWAKDRTDNGNLALTDPSGANGAGFTAKAGGLSGSLGVVYSPLAGTQLYASYAIGKRMPSLTEATTGFFTNINRDLQPETAHNFELGVNHIAEGVWGADRAMLKFSFFHNDVRDYIARLPTQMLGAGNFAYTGLQMHNIHAAKMTGFEMSGRYERGALSAELSGTLYTSVSYCLTAGNCKSESLYGDYTTNQVPPRYDLALTVTHGFLDDRLVLGGRANLIGARAAEHEPTGARGASPYIAQVKWEPYSTLDLFGSYRLNDKVSFDAMIENVTDTFYVDALSQVANPAPGRTVRLNLTARF